MNAKDIKICLISSSGGHFEQLKMLGRLRDRYSVYVVTEKTKYKTECDYTVLPSGGGKLRSLFVFFINIFISLFIFAKEKPDVVVSTGTSAALPTIFWAHLFGKKIIYIETFARIYNGTRSAKIVYKHHWYDLFIYQWETLEKLYPDGVYGGGIY